MIDLHLSPADQKLYDDALLHSHQIDVHVSLLDQNESHLHEFEGRTLSGQVDYQLGSPRILTLQVDGPVPFEPDSPHKSALYAHRFMRVQLLVHVTALHRAVRVPVFWGPLTAVTIADDGTTITATGKESLLQEPHIQWRTFTRKKGAKITDVIRDILEAMGETRIDLPDLDRTLPKPLSITPDQAPWPAIRRLARSVNRQIFYDGRGYCKMRVIPEGSRWTWWNPLTAPQLAYSMEDFRNVVKVYGPETHGKYDRIKAVAVLPSSHPLSPVSLARNDVPRYLAEVQTINAPEPPSKPDDKASKKEKDKYNRQYDHWHELYLSRQSHADELAARVLRQMSTGMLDVQFNGQVVPDIEEGDVFGVAIGADKRLEATFQTGTIPLRATEDGMSVGFKRHISWRTRKQKIGNRP